MLFRVKAQLGFANGSMQEILFNVRAEDKDSLKAIVTRDYIMQNVSNDWGLPIENVTIVKAFAIMTP